MSRNATEPALKRIRNIGIAAHIDAGKTTCSERVLYYAHMIRTLGEVHDGAATMDFMAQEQERGITIQSAAGHIIWTVDQVPYTINIIDTPGHVDFGIEVERALAVLDGLVSIFCAVGGVQTQSITNWMKADNYGVPRIAFINKMDRSGADFFNVVEQMRTDLPNCNPVVVQLPIGKEDHFVGMIDLLTERAFIWDRSDETGHTFTTQEIPADMKELAAEYRTKLIDSIVENDETLFDKYCSGTTLTVPEVKAALRKCTVARQLVPVLCGSALRNKGVQPLLDAVVDYLPSPLEIAAFKGTLPDNSEIELSSDVAGTLAVQAFKITKNDFGNLTFVRVVRGKLLPGMKVWNSTQEVSERPTKLVKLEGIVQEEVKELVAGDIGAIIGCKHTLTGDTLCDENHVLTLRGINIPEAVVSQSIEAKTRVDQEKLMKGLAALAEMDPSFKWTNDSETGQTLIHGLGELHLEITVDRLAREYGVAANVGKPQVAFRETVRATAEAVGEQKKQSGGHGQFAVVKLRIEPVPTEPDDDRPALINGVIFVNDIKEGAIPKEFIPDVETGVREAAQCGALAGYPVVGVMVTLFDGKFHDVDSSKIAFKLAAIDGFKKAFHAARPALLEPMGKLDVVVPAEYTGAMHGEILQRRGKVTSSDSKNGQTVAVAMVPMSEMFGFTGDLRSKTKGKGASQVTFCGYEQAPDSIARELLEDKTAARAKK